MQKSLFANLISVLTKYPIRFVASLFLLLFSNLLLIANPLIFRHAVHLLAVSPTDSRLSFVINWSIILLVISSLSALFKYWTRMGFIAISREAEKELRARLFERIQYQSRAFFDKHGSGELLSRLTNDIASYRDILGPGVLYPMFFATMVIPGLIALFSISAPLAALSLLPMIVIPAINELVRGRSYKLSLDVQSSLGDISNDVQEHYTGIRVIKGYSAEKPTLKRFRERCKEFEAISFKMYSLQGSLYPLFSLLTKITTVLLVLFSGWLILVAHTMLTTADFISFMWIQSYILSPVLMLGWVLPIYERGRAAYARLVEIYEEPNEVMDQAKSDLKIPLKADLTVKNLTFFYPGSTKPALSHLNVHVTGGSFIGVTGPVGSGKTTLLYVLNREYEVPKGTFFIGPHEVHEYPLEAFRAQMVAVEQAAFLFSRTVAENVRFGRLEASQEEIEVVSRYADLHDTVMEFPARYNTIVGERGMTLSGGQKQRVAVARALLVNRSILLLDDIFSAVDTATEKRIFNAIRAHFKGRTVLLVTHRVSVLELMDRVVYMIDGRVVEDGTPEELKAREGHYAALVDLQEGE